MLSENRRNYRKCPFVAAISTDLHNLSSLANTTTALISVEAACMSKPPYWIMGAGMLPNSNLYLSQGAALRGLPCWIIHGGIHFWQLPRQGVCKLSIGIPHGGGGCSSCASVMTMMDDDGDTTIAQISCSRSLRGTRGLKIENKRKQNAVT